LNRDFPEDLNIVYRHFPLIEVHKNALPAAKAAEAAAKQGKFWEMHNLLFEKQEEWGQDSNALDKFISYAEGLGLDVELFKSDFDSKEVQDRIAADMASGDSLRVNATPTFFLNGNKVSPRSYDEFKNLVEREIE
jgi:protein-disulfide isomerase